MADLIDNFGGKVSTKHSSDPDSTVDVIPSHEDDVIPSHDDDDKIAQNSDLNNRSQLRSQQFPHSDDGVQPRQTQDSRRPLPDASNSTSSAKPEVDVVDGGAESDASTEGADSPGSSAPASPLRCVAAGGYSLLDPPIIYARGMATPSPLASDDDENDDSAAVSPLTSPTSSSSTSDCGTGRDFLHCNPETVAANRNLHFPDTSSMSTPSKTPLDAASLTMMPRIDAEDAVAASAAGAPSSTSKHLSEGQLGIFSVDLALMRYEMD